MLERYTVNDQSLRSRPQHKHSINQQQKTNNW